MKTAALATATFHDTWAGAVPAQVVAFRTKRRGETVTRYRWQLENGQACGGFAAPFSSPERAVAAVARHACFSGAALA